MSSSLPDIDSSSSTMSLPPSDLGEYYSFRFYLESSFDIPNDIKYDIIHCQRALKAHLYVHQMVLDVFEQQADADPLQKQRILNEIEGEIYEINAEQNFLLLRLKRILDEFIKMLTSHNIPIHKDITNAFVSNLLIPLISNTTLEITPITVKPRCTEEKLIEKYFEVQKDTKPEEMEIINLDDDDESNVIDQQPIYKAPGKERSNNDAATGESLLKNLPANMATQTSLLKPFNQRTLDAKPNLGKPVKTLGDLYKKKKEECLLSQQMAKDLMSIDVEATLLNSVKTLGDIYQQKKEEKDNAIELPVSTNVKMSRMNLRQALKRAQAAVRGPTSVAIPAPPPPPPAPVATTSAGATEVAKKSNAKTRAARAAAVASSSKKSPERISSSSGDEQNYWHDDVYETRSTPDDYGKEMFLRCLDLFTPKMCALMRRRRSKRNRRCVKNSNYHYGKIDHPASSNNEADNKKKRKAFLLSPQVKKASPPKRAKRSSADNKLDLTSASTSRSASSSPNDKQSCNECLKAGKNLQQCEECKLYYHARCHREEEHATDATVADYSKRNLDIFQKCPGCKRKHDKALKDALSLNKKLLASVQNLELQLAKEKDRNEILCRTGKSYKIQMNNIFNIVNSVKNESSSTFKIQSEGLK